MATVTLQLLAAGMLSRSGTLGVYLTTESCCCAFPVCKFRHSFFTWAAHHACFALSPTSIGPIGCSRLNVQCSSSGLPHVQCQHSISAALVCICIFRARQPLSTCQARQHATVGQNYFTESGCKWTLRPSEAIL